ncbi:MAG: hypothetical protein WA952_04025, partial [Lewinella sp.]
YLFWPALIGVCALFVSLTLTLVAPFFDVPGMVQRGMLDYYSDFLLGEEPKDGVMTIHGGTLFDYYFTLDRSLPGPVRTRQVLVGYLRGLLAVIEAHDDNLTVRGTSYIVGERTARRVGLSQESTDTTQYLILGMSYLNLMVSMRLVKGRWELPDLKRVRTFTGRVGEIREREPYIRELLDRLERRL